MAYTKTRPSKAVHQHLSTGQRSEIRRTLMTKVNRSEEFTAEVKRQARKYGLTLESLVKAVEKR